MKMPTFNEMQRVYLNDKFSHTTGYQLKQMSNMVFDETFSNSTTYRKGIIYTADLKEIEEIEFKFIKTKTFTFGGNQVEYWIQFKTGVNPEIDYANFGNDNDFSENQKYRLGYYIDILDDNTKLVEKWLIVGKDQSEFDRYNVLKCNWDFEWIDSDRQYHKCLGCIMEANSYNDGTTSDGFTTVVDNIATFVFPTNQDTRYLDYNTRFMVADSTEHPKTYRVTKITDTSPFGITKGSFAQALYNEHTDLCRIIKIEEEDFKPFNDGKMHMICDYFKSTLPPIVDEGTEENVVWKLSEVNDALYIHGQPQVIKAISNSETNTTKVEWHIKIDNVDYTVEELAGYFDINIDIDNNTFIIAAINKVMAKYIVRIEIYDENRTYYDFVEMEVLI